MQSTVNTANKSTSQLVGRPLLPPVRKGSHNSSTMAGVPVYYRSHENNYSSHGTAGRSGSAIYIHPTGSNDGIL